MRPKSISEILKKVRSIEIRTNRLVNESLSGQYHSVFRGSGIDFDEVREYTPGDDIRAIDWKVTARNGRPFIKKYREDRELTIMLVIDISASGYFGSGEESKRERAAELASVLAFSAIRNRDKVGLLLFTDRIELYIPPAKGHSHVLRVIREILFHEPTGCSTDIPLALDSVQKLLKRKAVLFLISDFCIAGDYQRGVLALRPKITTANRRHDLVGVSISDPRDRELPNVGLLTVEDAETGEIVEINTMRKDVRDRYADEASRQFAYLKKTFRSNGIDLMEISTDAPYLPVLRNFFEKRERMRR